MKKASDILRINHDKWTRVKVEAKLRLADTRDLPDSLLRTHASNKQDLSYFFQDGINPDLVYVNFILDSEGANGNWDFMPRSQLVRGHATCRYKPFDMQHVIGEGAEGPSLVGLDKESLTLSNTIYGVMTHASLANADGVPLTPKQIADLDMTDDINRKPSEKITVVAWAALYSFLFPNTVTDLIDAVESGDMKVSMERWTEKFDYMAFDGSKYTSHTAEDAAENGIEESWTKHLVHAGKPVYRRTLAYVYGGAASVPIPANPMAKFLGHSEIPTKAVASLNDPVLNALLARHSEIHECYEHASAEEKVGLVVEHRKLHLTIAAYTGQDIEQLQ